MVKEKNRYALWLLVLCWLAYTCSYIGKLSYSANITISSYSLGAVADGWGWNAVFYVLLAVCGGITVAGLGYFALSKAKARREKNCQEEN